MVVTVIISSVITLAMVLVFFYVREKIITNRVFKPIPVKEAELLIEKLIIKKYGRKKNSKRAFYNDFILVFPEFAEPNYSYKYILQCLRPSSDRTNPELLEAIFRFYKMPNLVEGSIASSRI